MYREVLMLLPKEAYVRATTLWDKLKGLDPNSYGGNVQDGLLYAMALGLTALDREAERLVAPSIIVPPAQPAYGKLTKSLGG